MKTKVKTILYIGVFISMVFLLSLISDSFAVYETLANGTGNFNIGNWTIRLNDMDISSGQTISFVASNFNYSVSSHIENGVIAPGRSGYFDVIIDPEDTDVAIRYDITLDMEQNYGENITYYVTDLNGTMVRTGESTYSGIITLAQIANGDTARLRIVVEWTNNSTYDQSDTNLGLTSNASISIPAQITVIQYLGETLVEYIDE